MRLYGRTQLTFPLLDETAVVNPDFHLKKLDEFLRLRCIPRTYQLAAAYTSIVGVTGKQWLEAVSHILTYYEPLKSAFLITWRSAAHKSPDKFSPYQAK